MAFVISWHFSFSWLTLKTSRCRALDLSVISWLGGDKSTCDGGRQTVRQHVPHHQSCHKESKMEVLFCWTKPNRLLGWNFGEAYVICKTKDHNRIHPRRVSHSVSQRVIRGCIVIRLDEIFGIILQSHLSHAAVQLSCLRRKREDNIVPSRFATTLVAGGACSVKSHTSCDDITPTHSHWNELRIELNYREDEEESFIKNIS